MFCYIIGLSHLSCGSPWMFVTSLVYSWRPLQMYYYSGVCNLSQNVSSIIVPRCLSSDSLMLLENHSFKSCSEDRVKELIPDGSGIGGAPLPLHPHPGCLILLGVVAGNYCPHVGTIPNKIAGLRFNLYS